MPSFLPINIFGILTPPNFDIKKTDHIKYDIAIDLLLMDSSKGQLRVFQRNNGKKSATPVIKKVTDKYSLHIPKGKERYRTQLMPLSEVLHLFEDMTKFINREIENNIK